MLRIAEMREEDLPAVLEVENLSFIAPKEEGFFKTSQNKYLIAREEDKIVGYIGFEKVAGETHIINMAVHPDHRRKGIARRLLEEVLSDRDVFFLEVRMSNRLAQKLYHKYGFENVGIRQGYYSDNGEDAYIMRRNRREQIS
jgi:ribosomal-protein-alanine N-acetyltransferase